jgi:hypothetical protein
MSTVEKVQLLTAVLDLVKAFLELAMVVFAVTLIC